MSEELTPENIQKRELLAAQQTITKLQERVERLEFEGKEFKDKYRDLTETFKKEKEHSDDVVSLLKNNIEKLEAAKLELETELTTKTRKIEENEEIWRHHSEQKQLEWEAEKNAMLDRYRTLDAKYIAISNFERDKANLEADRRRLQDELEGEKHDKVRMLADKDREKVQATDKLKKDMLHKIQETKTSLLALKKEQLKTTTRLTVLQNHQLTTELEYQSKQTEKLLFKNAKLQEQVNTLKRDVEIHKQVEAELAKRSHYSQSLIKKMSDRIKELEAEVVQLNDNSAGNNAKTSGEGAGDKSKDDLITFLEKNLESTEKKLAKLQNDYDILRNEYEFLELKVESSNNKFENAALLLKDNLDNLLYSQDKENNENYEDYNFDINEIKGKAIDELNINQKEFLLNILLEQIKPYLNKKMLASRFYDMEKTQNTMISPQKGENPSMLPNIYQNAIDSKFEQNKFKDVPVEISSRIVRSNLRDWGKPVSMPSGSVPKGKYKYKL